MADAKTFMVEDARLIFRNFSGEKGPYNQTGAREFSVILPPEDAAAMAADGWNVKTRPSREEGDEEVHYITVVAGYKGRPPRVVMIRGNVRTNLTEDMVGVLDHADIASADLIARAYEWEVGDKTGTKAYLQSLFVTVAEDALERKYSINEFGE